MSFRNSRASDSFQSIQFVCVIKRVMKDNAQVDINICIRQPAIVVNLFSVVVCNCVLSWL